MPVLVAPLLPHTITDIAAGETFSLFLTSRHTILSAGIMECDEETDPDETLRQVHEIPVEGEVLQIAAGARFALLLVRNRGETEVRTLRSVRGPAAPIAPLAQRHITAICAGASHCVAVSSLTGRAWAWGSNYCGELGSEGEATDSPREVALRKGETFVHVEAGNCFNVAMTRGCGDHVGSEVVDTLRFDSESESDLHGFRTLDASGTKQVAQAELARTIGQTGRKGLFERVESDVAGQQSREELAEGDQNDIIFASRAERAAALERQFRTLRSWCVCCKWNGVVCMIASQFIMSVQSQLIVNQDEQNLVRAVTAIRKALETGDDQRLQEEEQSFDPLVHFHCKTNPQVAAYLPKPYLLDAYVKSTVDCIQKEMVVRIC